MKDVLSQDQIKIIYRGNYTLQQAALYLAIGKDKLEKYVKRGEIGIIVFDGHRYISRIECDRWLQSKTHNYDGRKIIRFEESELQKKLKLLARN